MELREGEGGVDPSVPWNMWSLNLTRLRKPTQAPLLTGDVGAVNDWLLVGQRRGTSR